MNCLLTSDLHGESGRYGALWAACSEHTPSAIFLAGDLLPGQARFALGSELIRNHLLIGFRRLRDRLGDLYPDVFLIPGNDDPRYVWEDIIPTGEEEGLWRDIHARILPWRGLVLFGYAFVPPSPFLLKDWEKFDVSHHVDVGCVSPWAGMRTFPVTAKEKDSTIAQDLEEMHPWQMEGRLVGLFHVPPYRTPLDRAALDGVTVDYAPVDVHVGSIAVRRFIEVHCPLVTFHGHVHESARLTGTWLTHIGETVCLSAAHDGPEASLIHFDLGDPGGALRELRPPDPDAFRQYTG